MDRETAFEEDVAGVTAAGAVVDRAVVRGQTARVRRRTAGAALVLAVAVAVPVALTARSPDAQGPATPGPSAGASEDPGPVDGAEVIGNPAADSLPMGPPPDLLYAHGDTVADVDLAGHDALYLTVDGDVQEVVRVGDRYAVLTTDGESSRLALWSVDGSSVELDRGDIIGLAAGDAPGEVALAWALSPPLQQGEQTTELRALADVDRLDQVSSLEVSVTLVAKVLDVVPGGVVFADWGDPAGPPQVWDPASDSVEPLVSQVAQDAAGVVLLGLVAEDSVAVIYDEYGSGCISAYDLGDAGAPLWERCVEHSVYYVSPDGHWLFDGTSVSNAATGAGLIDLGFGASFFGEVAWEDANTLLVAVDVNALVRCTLPDGVCERTTSGSDRWLTDDPIVLGSG